VSIQQHSRGQERYFWRRRFWSRCVRATLFYFYGRLDWTSVHPFSIKLRLDDEDHTEDFVLLSRARECHTVLFSLLEQGVDSGHVVVEVLATPVSSLQRLIMPHCMPSHSQFFLSLLLLPPWQIHQYLSGRIKLLQGRTPH
jgi:hypothetical protein